MNRSKFSDIRLRLLSAIVLIPLAIFCVWMGGVVFAILLAICFSLCLYEWVKMASLARRKRRFSFAGLVYLIIAFSSCWLIRDLYSWEIASFALVLIWASDIGGYFFGKTFDGPKLYPPLSPGKTWSGLAGAIIFPLVFACMFVLIFDIINWPLAIVLSAAAGLAGQAGDLMVSFMKRRSGIKDSSHLIPGHGGVLDRLDSLLLAAPVFLAILTAMNHV